MEKIISITNVEQKTASNSNQFLQITDQDGKKHSIFDQAKWNLCQKNATVKLIGLQSGKFFNVEDVQTVEAGEVPQKQANSDEMSKEEWATKQRIERSSIERQSALKDAIELVKGDKITVDKILSYTEVFFRYFNGDITVKDEDVFQALLKKTFNVKD